MSRGGGQRRWWGCRGEWESRGDGGLGLGEGLKGSRSQGGGEGRGGCMGSLGWWGLGLRSTSRSTQMKSTWTKSK